ncbi:MAG: DEAD/DEAH box helicase, partial [Lachnospiraceae bacterium]|nr:DEAD/DEAH box helicase [Lachnospiraceae bacterium]
MEDCLQIFHRETADWFTGTLGEPTPVQKASWPAIAAGGHVLVSAPTGTGKTLSAFLVFLDRLKERAEKGCLKRELYLIYVSPLKSLAADIRENLKKPLTGIGGEELIYTSIRTGDTSQRERQQMVRKPPHILIITPESLYLMLTSKTGQNVLCTAKAVIVDELHALIDTKRGAHLMLSLARLDALCQRPLQRIGLSATISPLDGAARYLAPEPVWVAAPAMEKKVQLEILGAYAGNGKRRKDPVWQELSELVYKYCQGNKSVIAFVEGRRYAEKLAYYVNLLGGENFARVHHGSLSKEQRQETEEALREGKLRLLCATSSMELGIDVGEIDQVLQVGCPRTVSGTMQRLGRAGHNPSRTSVMYLFPRTAAESISCGMTAQLAREGKVERMNPPKGCLDVLAQHLVSMAAFKGYEVEDVMKILPRAWPFQEVTREDVESVLRMLAGDYEHKRDVPVRPRILYDRIHGRVEGDGYSRMLAVMAGGTIPDKGLYTVRTEEGVKVGEADEEFVYETQKGDRFILGAFAWK